MKKSFITGVVVGGLLFGTAGVFAAQYVATENTFPIKINGAYANLEGYNIEGSTYFKLRDIGNYMGFNVDFQDNTILIESNNTSGNSSNEIVYYSEHPWCPDFGAFTGAVLKESKTTDNGTTFYVYHDTYSVTDHTKYFDLILDVTDLTLNPASTSSFILFENLQTGHNVSYMLHSNGTVSIGVN